MRDVSSSMIEQTMKALKRRLRDGQHTILLESRTLDKTALVFNALKNFKGKEEIIVIHIDLWRINSFFEAATNLVENYLREDEHLNLFKPEEVSGGVFLMSVITSIIEREEFMGKRILLFIDEFQKFSEFKDMVVSGSDYGELEEPLSPGLVFLRRLRSLVQKWNNVILFASGSDKSLMYLFGEYRSPFYKGALPLKIEHKRE